MLNRAHLYARKWRIRYSPGKSQVLVFGETKTKNKVNKMSRFWCVGNQKIEEVSSVTHVGVQLTCNFSSIERTDIKCKKGKGMHWMLVKSGVNRMVMNPLTLASLWNKICLLAMLYGAELWTDLTWSEIQMLERTQKYVAKSIQACSLQKGNKDQSINQ